MSLNTTLLKSIDGIIDEFISRVSTEYKLDRTSLRGIWDGKEQKQEQKQDNKKNETLVDKVVEKQLPDSHWIL